MHGVWGQNVAGIAGSVGSLGSRWRWTLPGLEALLLGTTDREATYTGLSVGGDLEASDGGGGFGGWTRGGKR